MSNRRKVKSVGKAFLDESERNRLLEAAKKRRYGVGDHLLLMIRPSLPEAHGPYRGSDDCGTPYTRVAGVRLEGLLKS